MFSQLASMHVALIIKEKEAVNLIVKVYEWGPRKKRGWKLCNSISIKTTLEIKMYSFIVKFSRICFHS